MRSKAKINYAVSEKAMREKIDELRHDLERARDDMIDIMPEKISEQLKKYLLCNNHDDRLQWWYESLKVITDSTVPDPEFSNSWTGKRANCPLCHGGNNWHYNGFSLPEGLRRHLEGNSGAHACHILKHMDELSFDYVERRQSEAA